MTLHIESPETIAREHIIGESMIALTFTKGSLFQELSDKLVYA